MASQLRRQALVHLLIVAAAGIATMSRGTDATSYSIDQSAGGSAQAQAQAQAQAAQGAASDAWNELNSQAQNAYDSGANVMSQAGFGGGSSGGLGGQLGSQLGAAFGGQAGGSQGFGSGFNFGSGGGSSGGFDLNQMLNMAQKFNPMSYVMPNTIQGFNSDLSRRLMGMANGASSAMGSAANQFGGQLAGGYQSMLSQGSDMMGKMLYSHPIVQMLVQNRMLNMSRDEARRVIEMIQNPEDTCKSVMSQASAAGEQAQKAMGSASSGLSAMSPVNSMLSKFGFSLGR